MSLDHSSCWHYLMDIIVPGAFSNRLSGGVECVLNLFCNEMPACLVSSSWSDAVRVSYVLEHSAVNRGPQDRPHQKVLPCMTWDIISWKRHCHDHAAFVFTISVLIGLSLINANVTESACEAFVIETTAFVKKQISCQCQCYRKWWHVVCACRSKMHVGMCM